MRLKSEVGEQPGGSRRPAPGTGKGRDVGRLGASPGARPSMSWRGRVAHRGRSGAGRAGGRHPNLRRGPPARPGRGRPRRPLRRSAASRAEDSDPAADRGRDEDRHVDEEAERERLVARRCPSVARSRRPPARTCRGSPGRPGRRRERDARREERRLRRSSAGRPIAWPAAANARTVHDQAAAAGERLGEGPRPARDREAVLEPPAELARSAASARRTRRAGRRRAGGGRRSRPQRRRRAGRSPRPDEDGGRDDAPDVEDEDRHGRDRDHDHHVDDPLDDDRAEGRRPADPLAVAEVVAPDELAEARRQDVVRRGSRRAGSRACGGSGRRWIGRTRRCQRSAAQPRRRRIRTRAGRRSRPGGGAQDVGRLVPRSTRRTRSEATRDGEPDAARARSPRSVARSRPRSGRAARPGRQLGRAADAGAVEQEAGDDPEGRQPVHDAPLEADRAGLLEVARRARRSRRSGGPSRPRRPGR